MMNQTRGVWVLALSSAFALTLSGAAQAQRSEYRGAEQTQRYSSGQQVSLPQGTVLKVRLDDRLSSTNSRVGDRFTATLDTQDTGLPSGTQVVGQVTDVRTASESQPGIVDVAFRSLRLTDGRTYPIDGQLIDLNSDSVHRTASGRLEARGSTSRNKSQFLGYGAGAGAIISALTGGNLLKGALFGALAGYAYQQLSKDKRENGRYSEVNLKPGTEFGVALQSGATFRTAANSYGSTYGGRDATPSQYDRYGDRNARDNGRTTDSYQPNRRGEVRVTVNGRDVSFAQAQPFMTRGRVMVPLEPVLAAAGYRSSYDPDSREVTIPGDRGDTRFTIGENFATVGDRRVRLDEPIQRIDGTIFVPSALLEEATNIRADWDANNRVLRLSTPDRSGINRYR